MRLRQRARDTRERIAQLARRTDGSKTMGYVWTRAEGHPRTKARWPYVLEHILVMEAKLGRYMLPHERVHHMNGQRADNRPENLELWKIKDPAGFELLTTTVPGVYVTDNLPSLMTPYST